MKTTAAIAAAAFAAGSVTGFVSHGTAGKPAQSAHVYVDTSAADRAFFRRMLELRDAGPHDVTP